MQKKWAIMAKGTLRNYNMEMRLLFQYHHQKEVEEITAEDITQYILFIKTVHGVGRAKCRSVAQSCAFFFRHVMPKPFVLPSKMYPRKTFVLPQVMTQVQVKHLLDSIEDIRQYAVISLLYETGIRIGELKNLKFSDIERASPLLSLPVVLNSISCPKLCENPALWLFGQSQP